MGIKNLINTSKNNLLMVNLEMEISKKSSQLEDDCESGKISLQTYEKEIEKLEDILENGHLGKDVDIEHDTYWREEF